MKIYGVGKTDKWLKDNVISRDDLESYYSEIYEKRFELRKSEGYEELEKLMENVEPGYGYSVFAQILTQTPNAWAKVLCMRKFNVNCIGKATS